MQRQRSGHPRHPPLTIAQDHWRSRWLYTQTATVLHRVSEIDWDDPEDMIYGEGVTVCGFRGYLSMPGMLSRMGLKRCERCCEALGVPQGNGAPANQDGPHPWSDA